MSLVISREGCSSADTTLQHYSCSLRLFLVVTLAGQRLFNSLLLAWLQVKGVTLNFLNYVCLLQLCVKTIEERFRLPAIEPLATKRHPQTVLNELVIYCNLAA